MANLLAQPLKDDPTQLIEELSTIEAWNGRVGYWLAEANSYLDKFQMAFLSKKEDQSEAERKVKLGSDTSDYRQVRDQIEVLCDSIKQKLILGESVLAYLRLFNVKPIMENVRH